MKEITREIQDVSATRKERNINGIYVLLAYFNHAYKEYITDLMWGGTAERLY